jgi:hypothetical protein
MPQSMRDSFRPGSGRVPRWCFVEETPIEPKPLRTFRLALHADQTRPEGIEMIVDALAPHAGWMPAQGFPPYAME